MFIFVNFRIFLKIEIKIKYFNYKNSFEFKF